MSYPQNNPGYQQPHGGYPHSGSYPAQQQYGHPGYQPAYPGYSAYGPGERAPRSNPVAGILLLLGALAGLAACLIPNDAGDLPIVGAFKLFDAAGETIPRDQALMAGIAPIALMVGSLMALIAGFVMFGAGRHGGAATTGLIGSILMLACPVLLLIATEGHLFDNIDATGIMMVAAWLPALVGACLGYRK